MSDPLSHLPDVRPTRLNLALGEKWFGSLIPDLAERAIGFVTDLDVLDDELLKLFYEQIDKSVDDLILGIRKSDEPQVRGCAHSLQGMGGVVGAPEISVLGEELSRKAIAHQWVECAAFLTALQGWRSEWAPPETEEERPLEQMPALTGRILVVDDELPNRRFLEKLLSDCGAKVMLAENGEQALEFIALYQPDLALVDVMMPGISGYEVCKRVTSSRELNQTMVIIVTARSNVEDVEHAFEQGAFDYIRKPFQSRELMARVRNALLLKKNTEALKSWNLRVSRDLETAGTVQTQLFDPTPVFAEKYNFRVSYRPSQHIGGDMFDLHRLSDGRLLMYVADVAGHGVGSALITTLIKGLISEIISGLEDLQLFEIGNELHRRYRLCVFDPELYATMILVCLDPETGKVETLSCGHPPPLVIDNEGRVIANFIEEKGGMPVGMTPPEFGLPYFREDEVHVVLPESSTMYLFTDGLIEAKTEAGSECGEAGLLKFIEQSAQNAESMGDPDKVLDQLMLEGYNLPADDCTLMSLRRISLAQILACGRRPVALQEVESLSSELAGLLLQEGWEADSVSLVKLLITEHFANVVSHGRCPDGSELFFRLTRRKTGCVLVMSDPGIEWDPEQWRRKKGRSPLFAESGRGLGMIARICRHPQHFYRDKCNHFFYYLEKSLAQRLHAELKLEDPIS